MKKFLPLSVISLLAFFLFTTTTYSLSILGNQITIYDQKSDGSPWHGSNEDQEVEPGMVGHQKWDLEGFFLDGNSLSMVGGFNFDDGESGITSGDIFFDVDGTPQYGTDISDGTTGNGNKVVDTTYGYDFAIKLDFGGNTFALFKATAAAKTKSSFYKQNYSSNPWQIVDDGGWDEITTAADSFEYEESKLDGDPLLNNMFLGDKHNIVQLTLPTELQGFNYVHFTEGCGNDNLMGAVPTPEAATTLLLATGLAGLAGFGRKRLKKNP